ncbi:MAG: hypothetical protein OXI16_03915, partial [Chloroflexota bacterium]|nr:hypothetical protein [Chloroflexota bacterium]
MTIATKLAASIILVAVALALAFLVTSRAYAQQSCTQVKMIYSEAWNTLYMIDGNGNRLVDIRNGNTLNNNQVGSYIVLRGIPSRIGIEIEGTGEKKYEYRTSVWQTGDRGYEDESDNDFNDAVILLSSISCPGAGTPPQLHRGAPNPPNTPSPSIQSVGADNITETTARAVVNIADHDGTELTVRLRYQQKADVQDWTTDVETAEATSSTSQATKSLENLSPDTQYVLQATLDSTFPDNATKEHTFTTERQPSVRSVSVGNIKWTSAKATINIADSNGSTQTAKLQYRSTSPQGQWSMPALEEISIGATVQIDLSGLTSDTVYEVQAFLDSSFPDKRTAYTSFRTLRYPSISNLEVNDETQTTADAVITIADPDGSSQTVHVRYRTTTPQGEWSDIQKATTSTDSAEVKLSGLTPDTGYEAEASLTSDFSVSETDIFRTLPPDPVVSGVSIDDETQTAATANISIANANGSSQTVHLRYRTATPQGEWSDTQATASTTDSAEVGLSGLTPDTDYEVEASLTSDFSVSETDIFRTLPPDPVVSGVSIDDETQTAATANISIANANGSSQTVHLRYRTTTPQGEWSDTQETTSTTDSAEIKLSGLTSDTEYEAEASLTSDFSVSETDIFRTLPPDPVVSGVSIDDETQTAATANISIANANGSSQTVHLRYRTTTPQGEWSGIQKTTSTTDGAGIRLSGLTANTEYDVQASLDSSFPDERTAYTSFKTLRYPSISKLEVKDETQTTAAAVITIADPDGSSQTVHVRYRTTTPQGEWSSIHKTTSTTDGAGIRLSGLIANTEYDVQASLDSSFPDERTAYTSFRTLRYPSISKLEVNDETQTTANAVITIADPDGSSQTVHVRYRTTAPQGEWSDTQKTTSTTDSAEIELSGLTPDTEYEAEASLTSDFSVSETDIFRTLPPDPVVSGVSIDDETQTAATANISIANANGSSQTVHLRYRTTTPQGEWSDTQETTSTTDSAEIKLSGLTSDTEYEAEASLTSDFSVSETDIFRTLPP